MKGVVTLSWTAAIEATTGLNMNLIQIQISLSKFSYNYCFLPSLGCPDGFYDVQANLIRFLYIIDKV